MFRRLVASPCVAMLIICAIVDRIAPSTGSCMGCVELDEITFDKMIGRFDYTLVKFDIAFPYGSKHEIYGDFAKNVGAKLPNFLVSLVGVKDYGEKENRVLAQRYQIDEKAYPTIGLFLAGDSQRFVRFPKDWELSVENLKLFVKIHAQIYIPLDGCIEFFDKLSRDFPGKAIDEQTAALDNAKTEWQSYDGEIKERAEIYINLMEKIIDKGTEQFLIEERKRVEKLLKGKLSDKKRQQLIYKRNILKSFRTKVELEQEKDEL